MNSQETANPKEAIDYFELMQEALTIIGEKVEAANIMMASDIFRQVHDYVQDVPLFTESKDLYDKFKAEMVEQHPNLIRRIKEIWLCFLHKVVSAPTQVHVSACIITYIPMLHEFISEYKLLNGK